MRRLLIALAIAASAILVTVAVTVDGDEPAAGRHITAFTSGTSGARHAPSTATIPSSTTTTTAPIPNSDRTLALVKTVTGDIAPKSVVASGRGLVFAQNMMYKHSITVYDAAGTLVKTIPDTVDLAAFGIPGHAGTSRGAPVEVAFTPDGTKAYVSNYSMYGAGFGPEGSDDCGPGNQTDASFVYRIDVATLVIDQVIGVGPVPKYVAVSPDGRFVVVTNWCGYDASIIDRATGTEVKRIPLGPYPRGIVISPDSHTAYVAVMGTSNIARIDLASFNVSWIYNVGSGPRHLVLSPDGTELYATLNGEGRVAKLDPINGVVQSKVSTGQAPRSMTMSTDGKRLYVVNYESGTMSTLDTTTMGKLQDLKTGFHPIGITYDRTSGSVWVANYTGSIMIFG